MFPAITLSARRAVLAVPRAPTGRARRSSMPNHLRCEKINERLRWIQQKSGSSDPALPGSIFGSLLRSQGQHLGQMTDVHDTPHWRKCGIVRWRLDTGVRAAVLARQLPDCGPERAPASRDSDAPRPTRVATCRNNIFRPVPRRERSARQDAARGRGKAN